MCPTVDSSFSCSAYLLRDHIWKPATLARILPARSLLLVVVTADSQVQTDNSSPPVSIRHLTLQNPDTWSAEVDGQQLLGNVLMHIHAGEQLLTLWTEGRSYEFRKPIPVWSKDAHATAAHGQLTSPMPGKVIKVLVKEGQAVEKGQGLVVIEVRQNTF